MQAGDSAVLDVAEWLWVFAVIRVRFVRGIARYRTWREVNAVRLMGHPAPSKRERARTSVEPRNHAMGNLENL